MALDFIVWSGFGETGPNETGVRNELATPVVPQSVRERDEKHREWITMWTRWASNQWTRWASNQL